MNKIKVGNFTNWYVFDFSEREKFKKLQELNKGFCSEIFLNNQLCLEITKRRI